MSSMNKAKCFQLTLNEVERFESLKEYLLKLKTLNYIIACKEIAPLTSHEHIHIYTQFNNAIKLSIKKCEGAHIEKCFGTPEQNVEYIKKDGDIIFEQGELRSNVKTQFPTIREVEKMSIEERKDLPIQYYNIVQKINIKESNKLKASQAKKEVTVIYYWGKSGVGKTKTALKYIEEFCGDDYNEVKYVNGFWIGVSEDCPVALYDDFRDSHMKPSEFINFIDYNIHNLNVKGGSIKNRYRHIFITSIQSPEEIYKNTPEEYKEQWLRRMEIREVN